MDQNTIYIIGAVVIVFLLTLLRPSKNKDRKKIRLGRHFHYSLFYESTIHNGRIIQQWVYDKERNKEFLEGQPRKNRKPAIKRCKEHCEFLNKNGEKEFNSYSKYAGRVVFKLSKKNSKKDFQFTLDDYLRYKELLLKTRFRRVTDRFPPMSRNAWSKADFRFDLCYQIDGLTQDEKEELFGLIFQKLDYTEKVKKKNSLSPWEDQFRYAYMYEQGNHFENHDYAWEVEKERMEVGLPPNSDEKMREVLSHYGVYIGQYWRYHKQGNFITIGGARSGKGVNLIIPQFLDAKGLESEDFPMSVVAVDIKGTLSAITAQHLSDRGYKVSILDPWNIQSRLNANERIPLATFNPLDSLDPDLDDIIDDCDTIAEMIVPISKSNQDQHWEDRARQWVSSYLLYMVFHFEKEDWTLAKLRSLFKLGLEDRQRLFYDMIDSEKLSIIKENGNELRDMFVNAPKEAQSILSVVQREVDVFKSPAMERSTKESSFDLKEITKGGHYLFVVIPPERLVSHSKWLRLVMGSLMTAVQRNPGERVLLLMDEFYSMGYMEIIAKSMGLMPEYNLQLWIVVQNLEQLKEHYPKNWETFIANSAVSTWLGIRDNFTSDYLAKLMGTRHIKYKTDKVLREELESGKMLSCERYEVPNQSPLQIRQSENVIYAMVQGLKPIGFAKLPYYKVEKWNKVAQPNPYLERSRETRETG